MADRKRWITQGAIVAPLVVAAAVVGCKSEGKPKLPASPRPSATSQENNPLTVSANIINIDDSPIVPSLTLDQNCGILFKVGDKAEIILPLEEDINGLTIAFEMELVKDPNHGLVLFSLPVEGGHSIAMVDSKNNILPLGKSTPLGGDRVFFAFFQQRKFKVKDCAVDNPQIH